jgi:hypothetical protein
MKRNVSGWAELTVRNVACLAFGAALAGCASDTRPVVVGQPVTVATIDDYCAAAQKDIANSRVPARNVIVTDFAAFSRATPSVKPLETLQFVGYADDRKGKPRMISCKLHSAEQIRAAYGATAAGESTTCARLNRRTLDAVMLTLSDRQKKKMPFNGALPVALDPDEQAANEREEPAFRERRAAPDQHQRRGGGHGRSPVLPPDRARLPQAHPGRRSATAEGGVSDESPDRRALAEQHRGP